MSDTKQIKIVPSKRRVVRSPAYPSLPLEKALERAKELYQAEKRHPVRRNVLAQHWGYKNEKGAFPVTLAALRKYGLVAESETDKGQEQLTDLAFRLIVDQPESDAWKEAVKKAALNPKLHS